MKKNRFLIRGKYRKFEKLKISYLLEKNKIVLSIICIKCKDEDEKLFKESIDILIILGLIENNDYLKNMLEENINQELRLKNIDETRNYFLEEIKQNELMSNKQKKVCATLNYIKHFILASKITRHISISACSSLIGVPIRITNSAIRL